ncbi:MAG: LPXTG cell wall anchor domain-containing protein [Eubacteriales bacterium]|nr:LPXTG cell wall anchor domain-containing protein [Eubacteriales bacterium]
MLEQTDRQRLLNWENPYDQIGSSACFLSAMRQTLSQHVTHNEFFSRLMDQHQLAPEAIETEEDLKRIPLIPANFFKTYESLSVPMDKIVEHVTSSGTSGQKSQMFFDQDSWDFGQGMIRSLFRFNGFLSEVPTNYLLYTYEPTPGSLLGTAKTDEGLLQYAPIHDVFYALRYNGVDHDFDVYGAIETLKRYEHEGKPVRIFGFPSFLYFTLCQMKALGQKPIRLNPQSMTMFGGGWKGYAQKQVSNPTNNHTGYSFNFDEDLFTLCLLISPYSYSVSVPTDAQPSDASKWGGKTSSTPTFLETLYALLVDTYPYEHQVYDQMVLGMNQVAAYVNTYLSVLRMYTEFGAQLINIDANKSEDQKRTDFNKLWTNFNNRSYRALRALEQAISLYGNELAGYMRAYDTDLTNFGMDYQKKRGLEYTSFNAKKTQKWMSAYLVKPVGWARSYAVLQGSQSGNNALLQNKDLISVAASPTIAFGIQTHYMVVHADFLNLKKSYSPGNYAMIQNASDLNGILSRNAYKNMTGFNAQFLVPFLKSQGMSNLPGILSLGWSQDKKFLKNGAFLLLDQKIEWSPGTGNTDADVTWCCVTQQLPYTNPNGNHVKLDVDNDIVEEDSVASKQPLVILSSTSPCVAMKLNASAGGSASLYTLKADGSMNAAAPDGVYNSGTRMQVKIKPDQGYVVSGVTLNSVFNSYKINLLGNSTQTDNSEQSVNATALLQASQKDADGYDTIRFSCPYQDAIVQVDFVKAPEATIHTVTLANSSQGELQFQAMSGLMTSNVNTGEQVIVYARAYEGNVTASLSVAAADGTPVDVVELPFALYKPTPNTVAYSFIMPMQDVTVSAHYTTGHTVSLEGGSNYTLNFASAKCIYTDWLSKPVTFKAGDWVVIKSTVDDYYYINNYKVTGQKSYDTYDAIALPSGIAFRMPAENVRVSAQCLSVSGGDYVVQKNTTGQGIVQLYDTDDTPLYGSQHHYFANATVKFRVKPNTYCSLLANSLSVTDYDGNQLPIVQDGNDSSIYTFSMPTGKNVTIHAAFTPLGTVTLSLKESMKASFVNPFFTQDDFMSRYVAGEQVKVVLYDDPETYVPAENIHITYMDASGNTVKVNHAITTLKAEPSIRMVAFTMPAADEVLVSLGGEADLCAVTMETQNSAALSVSFSSLPKVTENNTAYFAKRGTLDISFENVPAGAVIACDVYNAAQEHTTAYLSGDAYTLRLPLEQSDAYNVKYTVYLSQTLTLDSNEDVTLTLANTPNRMGTRFTVGGQSYLQCGYSAYSDVYVMATAQNSNFTVNFNSQAALQSSSQNPDGTYQKLYRLTMPDHNVFAHSLVTNSDDAEVQEPPKTGDNSQLLIWLGLCLLSGLGLLLTARKRRRA